MMDFMRQKPLKKKKKAPVKNPEKDKDKEGEGASSYATTKDGKGDYNCFCCGSKKCQLHHCPKKKACLQISGLTLNTLRKK